MTLYLLACVAGLAILAWSADRFVHGAASLAAAWGAPPLMVGITIVGIGTSAPELFVSLNASLTGSPGVAIGNAIGSNIANLTLVLGATALIAPLTIKSQTLRRELPIVAGVSLLTWLLSIDGALSLTDGLILLGGFVLAFGGLIHVGRTAARNDPLITEITAHETQEALPTGAAWTWTLLGLVLLPASAQLLVWGAVGIAQALGISETIIGLTVIAIGTSLPELATSIAGALKREPDLVVGNVLGSNMFNLLLVLPMPALILEPALDPDIVTRDIPIMASITLAAYAISAGNPGRIGRLKGTALLIAFAAYELILAHASGLL